jgi:hypothetical protein
LNGDILAVFSLFNPFKKDISSIFKQILASLLDYQRSLLQAIVLNQVACIISDECDKVIPDILFTICLLTLALGGEGCMSRLEFIIILQEGGNLIGSLACGSLVETA